jgi:hypothetical protein
VARAYGTGSTGEDACALNHASVPSFHISNPHSCSNGMVQGQAKLPKPIGEARKQIARFVFDSSFAITLP